MSDRNKDQRSPPPMPFRHAMSLVEPANLNLFKKPGATIYDQPAYEVEIQDDEGGENPPRAAPQDVVQPRIVPKFTIRPKRPPVAAPLEELEPARVTASAAPLRGRNWTMDEALPAPDAAPPRKVVRVKNPSEPEAPHVVRVNITHFGAASREELAWVSCGDPGVVLDVKSGGRTRRVACYLAFLITDFTVNSRGDREVTGIVRWRGLPVEREGTWGTKLMRKRGERLNDLKVALEYFLAFPDLRKGVAVQFVGAPLTDPEVIQRYNYMYSSGKEGDPAVKVLVNTVVADAELDAAMKFYWGYGMFWPGNHLKGEWPFIDRSAWDRYWLGRRVAKGLVEEFGKDGLTAVQRVGLLGATGRKALTFIGSLCRVAWQGDLDIEIAMSMEGQPPLAPTVYGTVWETE